jgi:hypothetical protein
LAFAKAGAKKVYAIDGADDNCTKLRNYIDEKNVKNIDIYCADFSEANVKIKADISWVYGIFHHLSNERLFLDNVVRNTNNDGSIFLYSYDADSLRDLIVTFARKHKRYESESDFRSESSIFSHQARMRVRDDLTAPVVRFYSADFCINLMSEYGYNSCIETQSFDDFLGREKSVEFNPHHYLFYKGAFSRDLKNNYYKNESDLNIIRVLLNNCSQQFDANPNCIYGLLNTHFSSVYHHSNPFVDDFKFLIYQCLSSDQQFDEEALEILDLFELGLTRKLKHEMVPDRLKGAIFSQIIKDGIRL